MKKGHPEYQVYVHNVDFEVTANAVIERFRHCGLILRWHFPRKEANRVNHGRHRGFGFIYFKTREGQQRALDMKSNPPTIGNRTLAINNQPG
jgi:RNA recognition motif-containing protein